MSVNPNPILAYCACGLEIGFCSVDCTKCICNPCGCSPPTSIDDCDIKEEGEFHEN